MSRSSSESTTIPRPARCGLATVGLIWKRSSGPVTSTVLAVRKVIVIKLNEIYHVKVTNCTQNRNYYNHTKIGRTRLFCEYLFSLFSFKWLNNHLFRVIFKVWNRQNKCIIRFATICTEFHNLIEISHNHTKLIYRKYIWLYRFLWISFIECGESLPYFITHVYSFTQYAPVIRFLPLICPQEPDSAYFIAIIAPFRYSSIHYFHHMLS